MLLNECSSDTHPIDDRISIRSQLSDSSQQSVHIDVHLVRLFLTRFRRLGVGRTLVILALINVLSHHEDDTLAFFQFKVGSDCRSEQPSIRHVGDVESDGRPGDVLVMRVDVVSQVEA
jgi:hypothetical protein